MAMWFRLLGSMHIEGSLAASPTMFCPEALTLTWKLVPKGAEMTVSGEYRPEPVNGGSVAVSSSSGGGGGLAKTPGWKALSAIRTGPNRRRIRRKRAELWTCSFMAVQTKSGSVWD